MVKVGELEPSAGVLLLLRQRAWLEEVARRNEMVVLMSKINLNLRISGHKDLCGIKIGDG
jgi:hypothetical protein